MADLLQARSSFGMGKTSGVDDPTVAEFLKLLPWTVLGQVLDLFTMRLTGKHVEELKGWRQVLLVLLPKVRTQRTSTNTAASASFRCFQNGTWRA